MGLLQATSNINLEDCVSTARLGKCSYLLIKCAVYTHPHTWGPQINDCIFIIALKNFCLLGKLSVIMKLLPMPGKELRLTGLTE